MKKSLKKVVTYLRQYVGMRVIRTQPAIYKNGFEDYSYMRESIIITGFTKDGRIKYRHIGDFDLLVFGEKERIMPIEMTDRNWISYRKALKAKNNPLNQWREKQIKRTSPTSYGSISYMNGKFPILIAASKHHILLETTDYRSRKCIVILGCQYLDGNWELAE